MFFYDQTKLAVGLGHIAHRLCCYSGPAERATRCDCKFGATYETATRASEVGPGCPEVSMAEALVRAMTPFEYARIARRARIALVPTRMTAPTKRRSARP